jgi:hypothetical protein
MEMPDVVRDEAVDRMSMLRVLRWIFVSMRMLLLRFASQEGIRCLFSRSRRIPQHSW